MNPDTKTVEGIQRKLESWFIFTYNTTENDPRLQEMDLEDLLVLFHMHRIRNNPEEVEKELDTSGEYESWLKEAMGDSYLTDDQMVKGMEEEEKRFQDKIKKMFPDKITTDFKSRLEE